MTKSLLVRSIAIFLVLTLLASCSAQKKFQRRLVGTWKIDRYEQRFANGDNEVATELGTITFRRNGSGDNDISVLTRGVRQPDNSDFSWNNTEDQVTIISRNTYIAKSWIVMRNKRKEQVWKSTTQANVQTMELSKVQ